MGGLVATRSIGQFSTLYGGIEDMVVGLEAVFPNGAVTRIKNVPRRAAGPDIRHVVIGNEGALCFITEVTVKLFPYFPENNVFLGYTLKDMKTGFEALRAVMVNGYKPSVARVYDPGDAGLHFSHFAAADDCVLLFMAEGPAGIAKATAEGIAAIVAGFAECTRVDSAYIETWFNDLCWGPTRSPPKTSASARLTTSTARPRSRPTGARSTTSIRRRGRASSPRSPTSR
jgi:alkyldihydroxyacetonephosphate synthase